MSAYGECVCSPATLTDIANAYVCVLAPAIEGWLCRQSESVLLAKFAAAEFALCDLRVLQRPYEMVGPISEFLWNKTVCRGKLDQVSMFGRVANGKCGVWNMVLF